MTEVAQKKGLSKGCMVGLIVTGIVVVVFIALAITCYMKREDIAKFGITTGITTIKSQLIKADIPDVDTVAFSAVTDEFVRRFNSEPLNPQKLGEFASALQGVKIDANTDAAQVNQILNAMYSVYPDLEQVYEENRSIDDIDSTEGEWMDDEASGEEETEGTSE